MSARKKTAKSSRCSYFSKIDVLVNVAGIVGKREAFTEVDLDDVVNTININLLGTILPEEIARAIWLLTLHEASAITGTTVMADDGYSSF